MNQLNKYIIDAENSEPLAVTRYAAQARPPRGVIILAPAMATHARHYEALANWFADRGFVVHAFDYQGYGESARTPLKDVSADILTWGSDAARVVDHVADTEGDIPLHWLGHSLGAQLLPFVDHSRLTSATLLCGGTGYWKHSEGRNKILAPALWYVIAPALTRLYGYYPGRTIRLLGDLPAPVMDQWARWCRNPDYMFGEQPELADRYAAVTLPVISVSVSDDDTMSASATVDLESRYSGAALTAKRYKPADFGLSELGHIRIARPRGMRTWDTLFGHLVGE